MDNGLDDNKTSYPFCVSKRAKLGKL